MTDVATIAADGSAAGVGVDPDLRRRLGWYRAGAGDPTTRMGATWFQRATWTPDGPASVAASWTDGVWRTAGWGPGADWALRALDRMAAGRADRPSPPVPADVHPLVARGMHRHPWLWAGASGGLYHELLPAILQQRITAQEAKHQWRRLCLALGEPAPGPDPTLRLPPHPRSLARRPAWWFHPYGIETSRARTLAEVARIADHLWSWAELSPAQAADRLAGVRGVGPWTIGVVLGPACGDDDAVAVGDYHIPNMVAWNLAGEARADDERMLSLLEPYRGQRGRVIRLLSLVGTRAPAFGARQRILPLHRW
jgi:endonuclease III